MAHTENIFSKSVLAETFPKPTLVRLLHVKYKAVRYDVITFGLFVLLLLIGSSIRMLNWCSQPKIRKMKQSFKPKWSLIRFLFNIECVCFVCNDIQFSVII